MKIVVLSRFLDVFFYFGQVYLFHITSKSASLWAQYICIAAFFAGLYQHVKLDDRREE